MAGLNSSVRMVFGGTFAAIKSLIRFLINLGESFKGFGTRQFLTALVFCTFCAWWNCLSQIYVDKMHWAHFKAGDSRTLPDIGFILLPHIEMAHLPDVWNGMIVLGTLLPVLLFHPGKVKIMRRFAAVQGTCFLLRSITIMATILPNPFDACVNASRDDEIPALEAIKVMLGLRHTCGDVLYSGHAANFTLMALIWQEYGPGYVAGQNHPLGASILPRTFSSSEVSEDEHQMEPYSKEWLACKFFPGIFWAVALLGYFIIIACRFHYTVDVLVGIVVVLKQWGLYHMVIRTPKLLAKVPFLQWLECKQPLDQNFDLYDMRSESEEFGFEETPRITSVLHKTQLGGPSPSPVGTGFHEMTGRRTDRTLSSVNDSGAE